jgi:hypothetical protein
MSWPSPTGAECFLLSGGGIEMGAGDNIECNDDEGGSMDRGCALPSNAFWARDEGVCTMARFKGDDRQGSRH